MKTTVPVLAVCLLIATVVRAEAEESARRATIPNRQAQVIAGELFPERCGRAGQLCGITYDDRRGCPFEFVIVFPPSENREENEARLAWVTLNKTGGVVAVTTKRKTGSCRGVQS